MVLTREHEELGGEVIAREPAWFARWRDASRKASARSQRLAGCVQDLVQGYLDVKGRLKSSIAAQQELKEEIASLKASKGVQRSQRLVDDLREADKTRDALWSLLREAISDMKDRQAATRPPQQAATAPPALEPPLHLTREGQRQIDEVIRGLVDQRLRIAEADVVHGASREFLMREITRLKGVVATLNIAGDAAPTHGRTGAGRAALGPRVAIPDAGEVEGVLEAAALVGTCADMRWANVVDDVLSRAREWERKLRRTADVGLTVTEDMLGYKTDMERNTDELRQLQGRFNDLFASVRDLRELHTKMVQEATLGSSALQHRVADLLAERTKLTGVVEARGARVAELERAVDERDRVVREQAEALVRAEERLQAATTLVEDRATAQRELREHLARLKEELQGSLEALLAAHAERTDAAAGRVESSSAEALGRMSSNVSEILVLLSQIRDGADREVQRLRDLAGESEKEARGLRRQVAAAAITNRQAQLDDLASAVRAMVQSGVAPTSSSPRRPGMSKDAPPSRHAAISELPSSQSGAARVGPASGAPPTSSRAGNRPRRSPTGATPGAAGVGGGYVRGSDSVGTRFAGASLAAMEAIHSGPGQDAPGSSAAPSDGPPGVMRALMTDADALREELTQLLAQSRALLQHQAPWAEAGALSWSQLQPGAPGPGDGERWLGTGAGLEDDDDLRDVDLTGDRGMGGPETRAGVQQPQQLGMEMGLLEMRAEHQRTELDASPGQGGEGRASRRSPDRRVQFAANAPAGGVGGSWLPDGVASAAVLDRLLAAVQRELDAMADDAESGASEGDRQRPSGQFASTGSEAAWAAPQGGVQLPGRSMARAMREAAGGGQAQRERRRSRWGQEDESHKPDRPFQRPPGATSLMSGSRNVEEERNAGMAALATLASVLPGMMAGTNDRAGAGVERLAPSGAPLPARQGRRSIGEAPGVGGAAGSRGAGHTRGASSGSNPPPARSRSRGAGSAAAKR